jgi:hypothetical protein
MPYKVVQHSRFRNYRRESLYDADTGIMHSVGDGDEIPVLDDYAYESCQSGSKG